MSIKKLFLSVALVAVSAFFGTQGLASAAPTADPVSDGKITAKDVRTIIALASGSYTGVHGAEPKVAKVEISQFKIRSGSCTKGSAWRTYTVSLTFKRGTLCNGKVLSRSTKRLGKQYFQSTMRAIMDRIFIAANLDSWGEGRVMSISSNGEVATLYFWKFSDGEPTNVSKLLRIVGSKVTVKDIGPGA